MSGDAGTHLAHFSYMQTRDFPYMSYAILLSLLFFHVFSDIVYHIQILYGSKGGKLKITINPLKVIITAVSIAFVVVFAVSVIPKASAAEYDKKAEALVIKAEDGNIYHVHEDKTSHIDGAVMFEDRTNSAVDGATVFATGDAIISLSDGSEVYGTVR